MTTTYTFNVTRDDLIKAALRAIGVIGLTQTPSTEDYTNCAQALNIMIKQWMAKGVVLWKVQEVVVPMVANQKAYSIGTGAIRPLRVLNQSNFIRTIASNQDTPVNLLGRGDYELYGAKSSTGTPSSIFYDPQLTNGQLYVYPVPPDTTQEIHLFCQMPFADFNLATDTPDFAQEWLSPLKWGLARELLVEYGCDELTERRIESRYQETMREGLDFSQDEASAYFTYDSRS